MTEAFEKNVHPGTHDGMRVFCKVSFDGNRLSITGVEAPQSPFLRGGSCGQIDLRIDDYAPGWSAESVAHFREIWKRWHLNDMRPGCEHQRAEGWDKRPIDPDQPLSAYGNFCGAARSASHNMLVWVTRAEHPKGLLNEPCPVCGYRYGSQWLHEDVDQDVLEWLQSLPETNVKPAWV